MPSVVLATLNAKYPHCAFGLRYLLANMGELRDETALLEFTINQQTLEILDAILAQRPLASIRRPRVRASSTPSEKPRRPLRSRAQSPVR